MGEVYNYSVEIRPALTRAIEAPTATALVELFSHSVFQRGSVNQEIVPGIQVSDDRLRRGFIKLAWFSVAARYLFTHFRALFQGNAVAFTGESNSDKIWWQRRGSVLCEEP